MGGGFIPDIATADSPWIPPTPSEVHQSFSMFCSADTAPARLHPLGVLPDDHNQRCLALRPSFTLTLGTQFARHNAPPLRPSPALVPARSRRGPRRPRPPIFDATTSKGPEAGQAVLTTMRTPNTVKKARSGSGGGQWLPFGSSKLLFHVRMRVARTDPRSLDVFCPVSPCLRKPKPPLAPARFGGGVARYDFALDPPGA
ncbi:hypothetical protein BD311DRAFT_809142 [Dichomitus squalens]|uniref:Uncharacterized protein n=1 Tax=Dichomitus squalens TaxID=114155 RepID=A0A4Q9MDP7_9APHY|nr:hypothetical protein BD311DRAFT_809142 [Dichomitus squalens]